MIWTAPLVDEALDGMSPEFAVLYSRIGRPSVPPEQLLRAMFRQAFYSIRSAKHLKGLRWKTPFEAIAHAWTTDPSIFKINPRHLIPEPYWAYVNEYAAKVISCCGNSSYRLTPKYKNSIYRPLRNTDAAGIRKVK